MSAPDLSQPAWARRGQWLAEHLSERTAPDGRTVLELVEEPLWINADATWVEYIAAIDLAIERDESEAPGDAWERQQERAEERGYP